MRTNPAILLPLLFFTSCTRYYYRPSPVNEPIFTGAGQVHALASVGGGRVGQAVDGTTNDADGNVFFWNVQAAASPINHLAVFVNYTDFHFNPSYPDSLGNVKASAHLLEGAIGGYYAKGRRVKLVADCFVGYGGGPIHSDVNMNLSKFFVQPGMGMRAKAIDVAFSLRISTINYAHFNANGRSLGYLESQFLIDTTGRRIDGRTYVFAEPTLTLRTGYKFLKVQMQAVSAGSLSTVPWRYNMLTYTLGVYFSLEDALTKR